MLNDYRYGFTTSHAEEWQVLVQVCQRWQQIIYGSVALGTLDPADSSVNTHPNPIPPRTARGGASLHILVFRFHSKTKRGQIPHRITADSCQFHSRRTTPFRHLYAFFGRVFVSVCLLFFACMFLNDVATMYKNQHVPLE